MAKFLFDVQQENRLEQKGMLKRFSIECVGKQATLDDMRVEKSEKFKELANQRGTREYDMWFLNYNPAKPDSKESKESKDGKSKGKLCACSKKTPAPAPESVKKSIKITPTPTPTPTPKKTHHRRVKPKANRTKKQAALVKLFGK